MKIAYIIEDFAIKGGAEHIIAEKANALNTLYGHEVTVITVYRDDRQPAYRLNNGVSLIRLNVDFADRSGGTAARALSRIKTLATTRKRLQRAISRLRPDIVFFTMPVGALMLPLIRCRARKVYESHSARRFTPYHCLFTPMELIADAVVCLTADDAREYSHARRTEVIPNFIETPTSYVTDYGVKRAIAVGRLEYAKGFDRLISCWSAALKANPGWQLDIYGEGSCRQQLEQQIKALNVEDSIRLCGNVDNIMDIYPKYSLNAVSSRYEGLNMAMIEAQACGLPSVVTDFNYGAKDIINDGYNGLIMPQGDTAAYARALSRMMADEALRASCGTNARLTAKRFAPAEIMEKWQQLVNRLCAGR